MYATIGRPRADLYTFDETGLNAFGQYLIRQGHLRDAIRAIRIDSPSDRNILEVPTVRHCRKQSMTSHKPTSRDLSARCPTGLPNRRPPVQNRSDLLRLTAFELRRAGDKISEDCWFIFVVRGSIG
jgi:hypothetical protein